MVVAGNPASRTRRLLVLALDVAFGPNDESATAARRATSDGPGRERGPAVVLDARRRGEERRVATSCRTSLLRLAEIRGQRRLAPGPATFAGRHQGRRAAHGRHATRAVANRPRFLRTLQCALRKLPLSRTGARLERRFTRSRNKSSSETNSRCFAR